MNIVFGRTGQVASSLFDYISASNLSSGWRFVSRSECDFSNPENVSKFLSLLEVIPKVIINAVAYTAVDLAETERETAMNVNAKSVFVLAKFCKENDVTLVHYSTDYIFQGTSDVPFKTDDEPHPINFYGESKLVGERAIADSKCMAYVIRVSWVYSSCGKNFVKTMLKLMQEREEISVVSDQIGSPTSARDIAKITMQMLSEDSSGKFLHGIYHFTNEGFCSWFEFATEICNIAQELEFPLKIKKIKPILTKDYPTLARRPLNSRLEKDDLNEYLVPWKKSLRDVIKEIITIV